MITKQDIEDYIEKIPPSPKVLRETLMLLNSGELTKAAKVAEGDLALKSYLKNIVNKPIYGFVTEVKEISQIFGILGVSGSQRTVYNYMTNLLSPDEWVLFKLNKSLFNDLQDSLSIKWKKILEHLDINDKDVESSITLLPSSIIITEALFCENIENVNLLRSSKALDYNTILYRLCNLDIFDICELIARKWEMSSKISDIVQCSSGLKCSDENQVNQLAKWMHLLFFYELSHPSFVKAGLNDFIDFQIDFVSDIYEDFINIMDIE